MKRLSVIIILSVTAFLLCNLQFCNSERFHNVKGEKYWREQNEKQAQALDQKYKQSISILEDKADSLTKQLENTKQSLKVSKFKQHLSENRVTELATRNNGDNLIQEVTDCDSLKAEALFYVQRVDSTQALYDSTIAGLEDVILTKDSALNICKVSYEGLKQINQDNLNREDRLTNELEKAVKQNKRKSVQNKFLAGGFLVLSGIITSIVINSKVK